MKASASTFWGVAGIFLFFGVGLYVCVFSNRSITDLPAIELVNSDLTNANMVSRDPAAIRRTYDFSMLEGTALESAAKNRLLSGIKLVKDNAQIGIELGHFVIKGDNGEKTFACQRFAKIALTFEGDGSAVNGELPKMEVEGACEMSADINSISPLMIPVARIMGEPVGDGEFNFRDGRPISVRFANVSDQWPTSWHLRGVRLFGDDNSNQEVVISPEEMRHYFEHPFILKFPNE